MSAFDVGDLTFTFSSDFSVGKYDEWAFYRNHFISISAGIKAIDLVAYGDGVLYLIEVKDYRRNRRTKPSDIGYELASKILHTLAAMLPAKCNATDSSEKTVARKACSASHIRVVLHLEQPAKPSRLFPRAIDPADVQQKLRQLLRSIDPHPMVVETARMGRLPWSVT